MAGIPEFIEGLRSAGFGLVFLWLLTLAFIYGFLSHIGGGVPKSVTARGIIAISIAFLVLLAASAAASAAFISNLVSALVVIGFGILISVIFLEIAGVKVGEGKNLFAEHGKILGGAILLLIVLIFIGLGGLGVVGFPKIDIGGEALAMGLFVFVVLGAVWMLMEEAKKEGKGK